MAKLIQSFDLYKDFDRDAYFVVCFDCLPSDLTLEFPLAEKRENMEAVLASIDWDTWKFKAVMKNWKTEDVKNPTPNQDFPYQYLFKSESKKVTIWVSFNGEELTVEILYDLADPELEAWVLKTHYAIRAKFGIDKKPTFKVLSQHDRRGFYTEDVQSVEFQAVDIWTLYNDDFQEIDSLIVDSFAASTSGLILLHGVPGTGKTSYIKHLISRFEEKNFIFIQNDFIKDLLQPQFVSFLLKHRNAILIIEDAEKVIKSRAYSNEGSIVSTILQLTDGLFSDYLNIKIICTFNLSIEKIDKALLRKGRMIASYEFKPLSPAKASDLLASMGLESTVKEMTLAEIFNRKAPNFQEEEEKSIGFR
ncbi:MAG: AAA family ATPase [Bacteroidota bacterium]